MSRRSRSRARRRGWRGPDYLHMKKRRFNGMPVGFWKVRGDLHKISSLTSKELMSIITHLTLAEQSDSDKYHEITYEMTKRKLSIECLLSDDAKSLYDAVQQEPVETLTP